MKKITFLFSVLVALATGIKAQDVGVIGFTAPATASFNLPANGQLDMTIIIKNFGTVDLIAGHTINLDITLNGAPAGNTSIPLTGNETIPVDQTADISFKPIDLSVLPAGTYQFCVKTAGTSLGADPNPANDQSCFTLIVGGSSVEEKSLAQFSAFPNPANNMINVVSPIAFETVRLFDMAGREVYSFNGKDTNHQINVSNLPVGLYFLSIEAEGNKSTKKVSIAR
jgi:hypothetical protein